MAFQFRTKFLSMFLADVDVNPNLSNSLPGCMLGTRENENDPFLLTPGGIRAIQIQPTLNCNLRCHHCYSESGPSRSGYIRAEELLPFLSDAKTLGYNYVGVSGGEPLVWPDLIKFLRGAAKMGYSTSVVTNGTLLTPDSVSELKDTVEVIAISIDGPPEEHNAMRASASAFKRMQRGLSVLRDFKVPFVLVFTLTLSNADRLSWIYQFADAEGARALEVHPLCNFGAASINLFDVIPDSREFKVASWLLALLVEQRGRGGPGVIFDVVNQEVVERACWPMLPGRRQLRAEARFSELVPTLIVEPDGCIVPFIYGFPRQWAIGLLKNNNFPSAVAAWRARSLKPIATLIETTLERLKLSRAGLIDLFGELLATAHGKK